MNSYLYLQFCIHIIFINIYRARNLRQGIVMKPELETLVLWISRNQCLISSFDNLQINLIFIRWKATKINPINPRPKKSFVQYNSLNYYNVLLYNFLCAYKTSCTLEQLLLRLSSFVYAFATSCTTSRTFVKFLVRLSNFLYACKKSCTLAQLFVRL